MWTCERWPTLSGRCQVRFIDAGEEVVPWFPKSVSPLPLLFLLQSLIDHPSPCFLLPDPRLAAGAQMETGCYSLY